MKFLRRYGPPLLVALEGILIGIQLPKMAATLRRRFSPLPGGPAPAPYVDPVCPGCRQRSFELEHYGHTHIPAGTPHPPGTAPD